MHEEWNKNQHVILTSFTLRRNVLLLMRSNQFCRKDDKLLVVIDSAKQEVLEQDSRLGPGVTFHSVLHVLSEQCPHDLC